MTAKQQLREVVDAMGEEEAVRALRLLAREHGDNPSVEKGDSPSGDQPAGGPLDDEPLRVKEAKAARGEVAPVTVELR